MKVIEKTQTTALNAREVTGLGLQGNVNMTKYKMWFDVITRADARTLQKSWRGYCINSDFVIRRSETNPKYWALIKID